MNLYLTRTSFRPDGVFGELTTGNGNTIAHTLEHAYSSGTSVTAKVPCGQFVCKRSDHRLHGMTEDFTTFEITGVEGHSNILFHWGNYNKDSDGCVLVGLSEATECNIRIVTNSREAFKRFMDLQDGVDEFTLIVSNQEIVEEC